MRNVAIEIRDRATFIPAMFTVMTPVSPEQKYLLGRAGWGDNPGVILTRLDSGAGASDPYDWGGSRTMIYAHTWLNEHHKSVKDGDVIDVEFLLGETVDKKISESLETNP